MKKIFLSMSVLLGIIWIFSNYSCNRLITAPDTQYIPDFHNAHLIKTIDNLKSDDLSLYVDYSTCIAIGQDSSPLYKRLVPSWVHATKKYYSIMGNAIKEENMQDSSTYTRLLSVKEVNYADLKNAVDRMADGNSESVLLTDGEYYNPTISGANPNNPYTADALKNGSEKGMMFS